MKKLQTTQLLSCILLSAIFYTVKAQDRIVFMSGNVTKAHVTKAKDGYIVYWKMIFMRHKVYTDKILYIQYADGTKKVYHDITRAKNYKNYGAMITNSTPASPPTVPAKTDSLAKKAGVTPPSVPQMPAGHIAYIERMGSNYRIDSNDIVGCGQINSIVSQSNNPAVLAQLSLAKTMSTLTTLSTIASFPGSAGSITASIKPFENLFKLLKAGPAPFKSYIGPGLCFMGTLSLPITSGILKHIKNILYDKTLVLYSAGN